MHQFSSQTPHVVVTPIWATEPQPTMAYPTNCRVDFAINNHGAHTYHTDTSKKVKEKKTPKMIPQHIVYLPTPTELQWINLLSMEIATETYLRRQNNNCWEFEHRIQKREASCRCFCQHQHCWAVGILSAGKKNCFRASQNKNSLNTKIRMNKIK